MHFNPWRLCTTMMSVPALLSGASVQHRPTGGSSGLLAQPLSHNHVAAGLSSIVVDRNFYALNVQ